MKIIAFAGLLFVTIYLPLLGNTPQSLGPTATPLVTATQVPIASATNSPSPSPTGQTPVSSETPAPTQTAQPTSTVDSTGTPAPPTPSAPAHRRVNAPHLVSGAGLEQAAIAWFGQVDSTNNYADVRVFYRDESLRVYLNIFDRRLWFDSSPTQDTLEAWDAVTLLLDTGSGGDIPMTTSHRFVAQLANTQDRAPYQAAYQGDGSAWSPAATEFTSIGGWRGDGVNNGAEARGWSVRFDIPFASLGTSAPPAPTALWQMAIVLHDRDDASGNSVVDETWPKQADIQRPSTWGELAFGMRTYSPAPASPGGMATIRHGLNGVVVVDAHVGGHSTCGQPYEPDFFDGWGDANYSGYDQLNIQNQWDVADWPCFSKYYVTFPMDSVPSGKIILESTLTMHLFGNSGQGAVPAPEPSLIQVLTIGDPWNESALTWNNAPLAAENVSAAWVNPIDPSTGTSSVSYTWDVSLAAAEAYALGEPLRLALYSADAAMHSGKYFYTSDSDDWGGAVRPSLSVSWGEPIAD